MSTGEADFICNLKTCRRPLLKEGWVTSCSHVFCEEDGKGKFLQDGQCKCPVCDTLLPNRYDVVHVNFNPSEEFKSMVLAGMRPEMILDIAGRAISFWAYQISSERSNQERVARKATERIEEMLTKHEAVRNALQVELSTALKKKEAVEKENDSLHAQVQALRDSLAERGRHLQKAQSTMTKLLRTAATKSSVSPSRLGSDGISPTKASSSAGSSPRDVFSMEQSKYETSVTPTKSHNEQDFTFKPALNVRGRSHPPLFPLTKM